MKIVLKSAFLVIFMFIGSVVHADKHASVQGGHDHEMAMHHMHIMINHAVEMAAEGSNLIMIGQMSMAKGVDKLSIEHGKAMIKHAKSLLTDITEGDSMMSLHKEGLTPEASSAMAYTHNLAKSASVYIDLLSSMSATPSH